MSNIAIGVVEALLIGVLVGSIYGLFSAGLSLVFGVLRLANFAYGEFVMLGMYAAYLLNSYTGVSIYSALPVVLIASIPVGVVIYWICFRGTETGTNAYAQLIIALGLSILLQTIAIAVFGPNPHTPTGKFQTLYVGPLFFPVPQLIGFGTAAVLTVALQIFLGSTALGRALRATVQDREMARMIGIRSELIFPLAFAGSVALGAAAGVVLYGFYPVTPVAGSTFVLIGFVCVILGGAGDTVGAFVAGLLVGVAETLTSTFWQANLQDTIVYILFVLVIILRPQGLFGRAVEAEH